MTGTALAGIRVVEMVGLGPGPFCGMILADHGAEVIRVDRPGGPPPRGVLERGKQTRTIDLKAVGGTDELLALIDTADALIDVFRPGVAERLGFGPDVTLARNPGLIYGRLTGYGQDGPWADRAGHDLNYLALAGALEPLGRAGGPPTAPINVLADFAGGGLLLAYGIAAALVQRGATGLGSVIDAAMIDGAALLLAPFYSGRASGGWGPRGTNMLDGGAHFYDVYQCEDARWLAVGAIEPQFYEALLAGLGLDAASHPQWDTAQWPALKARFAAVFASRPRDEWVACFDGVDACIAPVLDPVEATAHPHNVARDMFDGVMPRAAPRLSSPHGRAADGGFWVLDPSVTFLNHGSFGSCPRPVLAEQDRLRRRMESEPVRFLAHEIDGLVDGALETVAGFVGARRDDVVFVNNATSAVNAVLRTLPLQRGDEIVVTDHAYNACANAVHFAADAAGARVVVAPVPFPIRGAAQITDAVLDAVTDGTRLVLLDHVTSPTAIIFPVADIARTLAARGIEVLVDGAHAPGMLPLDLGALEAAGVAYYTGNFHKWVCAPKGAAFLWVRPDRQNQVRPLIISHGANTPRPGRSRFQTEFAWQATDDPTAWLSVPAAIAAFDWPAVMAANHTLCLAARDVLCDALDLDPPVPDELLGSMAAIPLPHGDTTLAAWLYDTHRIEVPVLTHPHPDSPNPNPHPRSVSAASRHTRQNTHRTQGGGILRVSCQGYNRLDEYERLAAILRARFEP